MIPFIQRVTRRSSPFRRGSAARSSGESSVRMTSTGSAAT